MQGIYIVYKCKSSSCRREMILLTDEVNNAIRKDKYLVCPYCSCKNLRKIKETNDFKDCFKNDEKKR